VGPTEPRISIQTGVTGFRTKYDQVINIVGANGRNIDVTFAWIRNQDGVVGTRVGDSKMEGNMFSEFEVVRLKRDQSGLKAGAKGTILMVYEFPRVGYDVEFLDESGHTLALLTLYDEDLEATPT
jgi:hypothetical protein